MTKTELVRAVCGINLSVPKFQVEEIVSDTIKQMKRGIKEDGALELRGFGTFRTRIARPRKGRNPKTGDVVKIPEKRKIRFKAGKMLKQEINRA